MALRVSTTGSDVEITDLGIVVTHPTTDRDLSLEFSAIELKESADLTQAIQSGDLDVDDGTNFIHQDDYDPDELLIQELGIRPDELYVSHDELASKADILIHTGVFPLSLNSTASGTRNVYVPAARFVTWQLAAGDVVTITGNAAAGTYTVESVTDQQNFVVAESVANSTGGTTNIYHPGGSTRVGVINTNLNFSNSDDLQGVLEDLDNAIDSAIDEKVKVTSNDSAAGYLLDQLEAGTGVTLEEVNDGGNEKVKISVTPSADQFDVNKMVLDCDGSIMYIGKGDILLFDDPLPGPVTETNCEEGDD